jgi:hypothetical protein
MFSKYETPPYPYFTLLKWKAFSHVSLFITKDILDMMSRGYVYLLLLDRAGQVGGSVEHSEGKGGESDVAILRFLCDSSRPCRLRTAPFWPR